MKDGPPRFRRARLASGLVLFTYLATHLANHALGAISMTLAEHALRLALVVWRSGPGTVLLYGAAATHVALAFTAAYERPTLRMPPLELWRMALGFTMPTLLIGHALGTRLGSAIYGHPSDYANVVWQLHHAGRQGMQVALLVPGWFHGCIGLKLAFARRPWFRRLRAPLYGVAFLLPALAVVGFLAMSREVAARASDTAWSPAVAAPAALREAETLNALRDRLLAGYGAAVVAVFAARLARRGRAAVPAPARALPARPRRAAS